MSLCIQGGWYLLPSHPHCQESSHIAEGLEQSRENLQVPSLLHEPPQSLPLQEGLTTTLLVPLSPEHLALGKCSVMRWPWVPTPSIPCSAPLPFPLTGFEAGHSSLPSTTSKLKPELWARGPDPTTCPGLGYSTWLLQPWQGWAHHYLISRAHQARKPRERERERERMKGVKLRRDGRRWGWE